MIGEWINYFWLVFFRYFYAPQKAIEGKYAKSSIGIIAAYIAWETFQRARRKQSIADLEVEAPAIVNLPKSKTSQSNMSNMQVSVPQSGAVSTGNREEESESVEETTLTEVTKDEGDSKMHQKTATFEGEEKTSLVEDHKTRQTEATKSVMQQETSTISANKQVFTSKFETSESFSMEEHEEYEIEG